MARPILAVLALLPALLAPMTSARAMDIHLAHAQPQSADSDPAAATASAFRKSLPELSGGTLRVAIFPEGQLGGNRDMAALVAKGVIHSALVTVGGLAPLYPPIAVTAIPFALDNPEAAEALFDGPFGQAMAADIEKRTGLMVLGYADPGGMHALTNSKRPIRTPADMAGLKIRTIPGYDAMEAMIRALGAKPVKVSSKEELSSLEAGIIDGQTNPPTVILSRRYHLVQHYATLTAHLYSPYVWVFNRAAFDTLEEGQRAALLEAAKRAVAAGRELGDKVDHSEWGTAGLGRRMQVTPLGPAERAAFAAATRGPVTDALARKMGDQDAGLIADFLDAARIANLTAARTAPTEKAAPRPRE